MIIHISNHTSGAMKYHFDNGNVVSIVWGWGSYSDNRDDKRELDVVTKKIRPQQIPYVSKTVEIMVFGDPKFIAWMEKNYDNPGGYLPVSVIPSILKKADSKMYHAKLEEVL